MTVADRSDRRWLGVLIAGTLATIAATCATTPEPLTHDPLPVARVRSCLDSPPPAAAHWVVRPCGSGVWCVTDADARAIAAEVEARRSWDAWAWESCR